MLLMGNNDADILVGSSGDDVILTQGGNDDIDGRAGDDSIRAGNDDDQVNGGGGDDTTVGGSGNDSLIGSTGDDAIRGGTGDDFLKGAGGDDVLHGGAGNDRLVGGLGDDRLVGNTGDDTIFGGQGADKFVFSGNQNTGHDIIADFEVGVDRLVLTNGATITDISEFGNGHTLLTLSNGGTVVLRGVTPDEFNGEVTQPDEPDQPDDPDEPETQTGSESGTVPSTGQELIFEVEADTTTDDGEAAVEATVGLPGVTTQQINIAFVYDESGSVSGTLFDLEVQALLSLTQTLIDLGFTNDQIDIGAIPFSSVGFLEGVFDPEDPNNDGDVNPALESALEARNFFGGTNFETALQEAEAFFAQVDPTNAETNIVYFLSDGFGGGSFLDEVARLTDPDGIAAQILAFGVPGADTTQLDQIDNTGGAVIIADASDLDSSVIGSPITGTSVDDFFILVNGVDAGIDEDDLLSTPFGFVLPEQILTGLVPNDGSVNVIEATVSFDDPDDTTLTVQLEIDGALIIA